MNLDDPSFTQDITYDFVENTLIPACEAWEEIGKEAADDTEGNTEHFIYTEEMFNIEHPYFAGKGGDACKWSITGFTPNGGSTFKNYFSTVATYVERINIHIDYLEDVISTMVDESKAARDAILQSVK